MKTLNPIRSLLAIACFAPLAAWAGPVDINTADAGTLDKELKGVGPARAQAIVAYRTQHGPFKSADDLALVKTIPQKVVEDNRDNIRIDGARAAPGKPGGKPGDARAKSGGKPSAEGAGTSTP